MHYIDMHNHCTWGIDDGIQSQEDCRILLETARNDGIQAIIATPHFIPGRQKKAEAIEMTNRMKEVKELAHTYGIRYFFGSEVFLNYDFLDMIDDKCFHTLAHSKYLLCEFNVREKLGDSSQVEDRLYELIIRGCIPVIAHVERYFHDGIELDRVAKWIDMGCYIQLNRTSLLGSQGKRIQKNGFELLKNNMAHLIATDAHRAQGTRICMLSDIYELIRKKYGEENANILLYKNPLHIIKNENLEEMKEIKKSFSFRLRKGA